MLRRSPRSEAGDERLSILIRHEGGCYPASSSPQPAARPFNPHPPRRRMLHAYFGTRKGMTTFQSSSATKADATRQGCHGYPAGHLSILIRHEGGCYAEYTKLKEEVGNFQSSSATKADATGPRYNAGIPSNAFNPHPPRRRMLHSSGRGDGWSAIFQSSSATKADATRPVRARHIRSRPFNPHPPRRRMLRTPLTRARSRRTAFNPHPPRRRMLQGSGCKMFINRGFQSSSATKADATGNSRSKNIARCLSILIRHEGGCYMEGKGIAKLSTDFQSSSATKADATPAPQVR